MTKQDVDLAMGGTTVELRFFGPQNSGKSTVMMAIAAALMPYGIRCEEHPGHRMQLLLPDGVANAISNMNADRELNAKLAMDNLLAARSQADKAEHRARESAHARDTAIAQFADLKRRLHAAEIEVARLGGYIEHVQETEDAARPPTLRSESYPVPPPPAMRMRSHPTLGGRSADGAFTHHRDMETARPPHWTGYGDR